ncbi:MAG TPA: extracellular solute-binding protein [Phycisphaerae bacterium]
MITPHDERIQKAFSERFNAARARAGQPAVIFEWNIQGTNEAVKFIIGEFSAAARQGRDTGTNYDMLFGGGRPAMDALKKAGCTQAVQVSPDILAGIPKTLGGIALYDPDGHWFGCVLAAFGIVYNRDGLRERGIPEPTTWSDLADPRLRGTVLMTDPKKSASVSVCYELILQKHGWPAGWGLLMRIAGNARDFVPSSRSIPQEVGQGGALAGPCIDFYGYAEVARHGNEHVGYISPAGATATTPDTLSVLKNAPHAALAKEFLEFILSPAGQALWALPSHHPDGPKGEPLLRKPIRPDVYEKYAGQLTVSENPFADTASAGGFVFDPQKEGARAELFGPLFDAAFLRQKDLMQRAWRAIIEKNLDAALLADYDAPPFSEEEGFALAKDYKSSARRALELDDQWFAFFRAKYERVLGMAK